MNFTLKICVHLRDLRAHLLSSFLLTLLCGTAFAFDKSGVKPNTISLPKGPGSIEGLGESFQPTLNTGTAKYGVPLAVPPGTAGQTPALALSYEGGSGNGILGFGWDLSIPFVQRRTDKGIPRYVEDANGFDDDQDGEVDEPDEIDIFINDLKEELVPQEDGCYFCKNEGAFVRYQRNGEHWEGTLPDGSIMYFGLSEAARVTDAETGRVFKWLLEKEVDTHGNTVVYTYRSFEGDSNKNRKYLAGIRYGPGAPPWANFHFVSFAYDAREDWFEDGRAGFIVRTGRRIREIVIGTQGPVLPNHLAGDFNGDGIADNLVRKYRLSYLDYAGTDFQWSYLREVRPFGADGTNSLPPIAFGYSVVNPPDTVSAAEGIIGGLREPVWVMDNSLVDLVDLNGDGLPDILKTVSDGGAHTGYINLGETNGPAGRAIQWSAAREVLSEDGLAFNVDLKSTENIAHLADMDGDGIADLACKSADNRVYYFRNTAGNSWGRRKTMSIQDYPPPAPFGDSNVKTADIDFDKRMDIIESIPVGNGAYYRVWFNLGGQKYSRRVTAPQTTGYMFSWAGVELADFNGDRVPDVTRIRNSSVEVTAGLGYDRFAEKSVVPITDATLTTEQLAKARLQDINGDGLVDLVIERASPGTLWYWLNQGNYSFSHRKAITGMPTGLGANPSIRWADLNGNGTEDLIYSDAASMPRIRTVEIGELIGAGPDRNLLTVIDNGIGSKTRIDYESSTQFRLADLASGQPWPDIMPNPVNVIARVTVDDSLGHAVVTEYRYHDGYYDPKEKEFRGFARVEQLDRGDITAPTLVTRSYFDTGRNYEVMKGKLLRLTAEREDGAVFWDETTTWENPPRILKSGANNENVSYACPIGHIKLIKECGQGQERTLESAFSYDNYGNRTWNADYGIVEGTNRCAWDDERITTNQYAINPGKWILRAVARQQTMDENGHVVARTENYYDDETWSGANLGIVTVGDLTMTRQWIDPADPGAFVESIRNKYDSYGNLRFILDPLASASGGIPDPNTGHYRELVYDNEFHAWPEREIIHIGNGKEPLVVQAGYDKGFGTVVSSKDFNDQKTMYRYDTFARLINILRPGDTPEYPSAEYDYFPAQPWGPSGIVNYVESRVLDKTPGSVGGNKRDHYFISRAFVDGLGRALMSRAEGERAGQIVVSDTAQFNARKLPRKKYLPYFEDSGSFNYTEPTFNTGFTEHFYDALGREIRVNQPLGSNGVEFSTVTYEPLARIVHDEEQTKTNSTYTGCGMRYVEDGLLDKDGNGRLREASEIVKLGDTGEPLDHSVEWRTSYSYDLLDNLLGYIDSQGNGQTNRYDALKHKTYLNDPDRGEMSYTYDAASNVKETRDARDQVIRYAYDGANRLLTEDYLDEGQPFSFHRTPDISYFYDNPFPALIFGDGTSGTATNTKGRLAYVIDLSGEEHTSYDERGRETCVVKRIPDLENGVLVSYATRFQYDAMDRVTTLIYPDNDQVRYEYNDRGLPARIVGGPSGCIISNLTYYPSGQQTQIDYGNGVRTRYDYDYRLRLTSLITAHATNLANPMIAFGYEFDSASNIRAIQDHRPATVVPAGDRRRNTQLFQYDSLYRLTRAKYSFNLPGEPIQHDGIIDYRYDRIGNMVSQTSDIAHVEKNLSVTDLGVMSYGGARGSSGRIGRSTNDPPGPHALTSITHSPFPIRQYPYDANGNMTDIDGLQCTWDFKDRLVAVEDAEMRAVYTYDYTDQRITKNVTPKPPSTNEAVTTLYVGKHFEIRENDQPVKYVFNGDTRVARITGPLSTNWMVQRLRVYPGWNLASLAVTAPEAAGQLGLGENQNIETIVKWSPTTKNFVPLADEETISAGVVLWIRAKTNAVLSLVGRYEESTNVTIHAGGDFVPSLGMDVQSLEGVLPTNSTAWKCDAGNGYWQTVINSDLSTLGAVPKSLAPGEAVFVRSENEVTLIESNANLRIRYYHQDHLGSSSVLTDAEGAPAEEISYYPFGTPRLQHLMSHIEEVYQFAQKERDEESGLHYVEARYLAGNLGRFICVDPLATALKPQWLLNPQKLNLYGYCINRPVNFVDLNGFDIWSKMHGSAVGYIEMQIEFIQSIPSVAYLGLVGLLPWKGAILQQMAIAAYEKNFSNGTGEGLAKTFIPNIRAWSQLDSSASDFEKARLRTRAVGEGVLYALSAYDAISFVRSAKVACAAESGYQATQLEFDFVKNLSSPVSGKPRIGSALKVDGQHGFPDLIDDLASGATHTTIPTKGPGGKIVGGSDLFELEGSWREKSGVFKWILDSSGSVNHRRFIPGKGITGTAN